MLCVGAASLVLARHGQGQSEALIASLVNEVSQENIQSHISALAEGIGPRASSSSQASAADYIANQLASYGYSVSRIPVRSSENVIATLLGNEDPAKTFVVGAHFDTVLGSPGADDNASGVGGMLEIARVLSHAQSGYSIDFAGFALEETGLHGSLQYISNSLGEGREFIGMFSLEMIGYTSSVEGSQTPFSDIPNCISFSEQGLSVGDYIAAVGNDDSSNLLDQFDEASAQYVPELHTLNAQVAANGECFSDTRRSDHSGFWDEGFPALMLTDTANFRNPNYHEPSDTLDTLDLQFARRVTQAALATVATTTRVVPEPSSFVGLTLGFCLSLTMRNKSFVLARRHSQV
jgi:Zn-dependent M28 family amino/carboxypeptidase